jgi:hypothetical protein
MITATAQVSTSFVTGSTGFSIGASSLVMSTITLGTGSTAALPLSAFGTTSATVTVTSGGVAVSAPQVVTFSSTCAGSTKAVLTSSVTTVNGIATASYRDNGCAGSDLITASLGSLATPQTATLYVTAPIVGSIQYVSATPAIISLAGTGGTSTSQVAFKVVDGGGNPISGKVVTFNLSTTVGGITLTPSAPAQATSDSSGMVYTNVNAGTMSTPVRVTASTPGLGATTLTTQSNQLTVTTGIPAQSSFSLSATTLNIEGWDYDGITTVLTARLADHFSNFPPDGTAINFISEGARVAGSCVTVNGDCSVTFNSQSIRPSDGRVTVLAFAVGEESFIDANGNGVADKVPNELVDILAQSTDMPEAWVDYDEDGTRNIVAATGQLEPFIDFNNNGAYDAADGFYNGVLCNSLISSAGTCSATKTINVRSNIVIVLSGSTPTITTNLSGVWANYTVATGTLDLDKNDAGVSTTTGGTGCGTPQTIGVRIVDLHGNLMPAGTTVSFAANNDGTIVWTSGDFPVQNSAIKIASIPAYNYSVTIKGDGSLSAGTCTDSTPNGTLTVTVTTPKGNKTTQIIANLIH